MGTCRTIDELNLGIIHDGTELGRINLDRIGLKSFVFGGLNRGGVIRVAGDKTYRTHTRDGGSATDGINGSKRRHLSYNFFQVSLRFTTLQLL